MSRRAVRRAGAALVLLACLVACERGGQPRYFPLQPGAFWRYAVHQTTTRGTETGKRTVLALEAVSTPAGRLARRRVNAGPIDYFDLRGPWIRRLADEREAADEGTVVLPRAPEVGDGWRRITHTALLERTLESVDRRYRLELAVPMTLEVAALGEAVTVPAGRFADCVKVVGLGRAHYAGDDTVFESDVEVRLSEWYAPGVGLVRSHRIETTTSGVVPRGELRIELEVFDP